ncbi:hypothetical protein DSM104635_00827 [Terricaulis silvestris]|uniref:Uncharacterized protein n=1 Tax=Terricaulis silvestris TaxID=2686094 RepID=A0A6I6MJF7_9CAUL|nr:hypothetical protein DSM104635_00827 [Terricaulis silvestris]
MDKINALIAAYKIAMLAAALVLAAPVVITLLTGAAQIVA